MPNPVVYSGFLSKDLQAWLDDTDLPQEARMRLQSVGQDGTRHNVLYYDVWEAVLDSGDTKTYTPQGSLSSQRIIIAQIIGDGAVKVSGKDYDNSTDIACDYRANGNEIFPGRAFYAGYNVNSIQLVSYLDGTIFHVKHLIICDDDDPLYF